MRFPTRTTWLSAPPPASPRQRTCSPPRWCALPITSATRAFPTCRTSFAPACAETIYLVAKRRSYPLTAHIAYAFGKLGIRHQTIASPNGIDAEIAGFATERDAVLAASFAPYAAESLAQAQALAARGVPIVAITDSVFSPLAAAATHWLEVSEADHAGFRSLSASMALAMALPVAIAERRRSLRRGAPRNAME